MAKQKTQDPGDAGAPENGTEEKRVRKSHEERLGMLIDRIKRLSIQDKSKILKVLKDDVQKNLDDELARVEAQREALLAVKEAG